MLKFAGINIYNNIHKRIYKNSFLQYIKDRYCAKFIFLYLYQTITIFFLTLIIGLSS